MSPSTASLVDTIDPPALGPGHPLFTSVTTVPLSESTTLVTVAGQVAVRPDGTTPDSLENQLDVSLWRVKTCLEAAGAGVNDTIRLMYYVTEQAHAQEGALSAIVEKVGGFLGGRRPASCYLVVKSFSQPQYLCEFEAQAVVLTTTA